MAKSSLDTTIMKLKFEKLKTDWEQYRATILNYTLGLITIWVFGMKYLVIDLWKDCSALANIFLILILSVTISGIICISSRIKLIGKIKEDINELIEECKK
ncbi:MAG: hypothetical protein KAK00_07660 [Nanoarchaeota archaeon]|nr:hypothetical protein [Nanoarchaeota archaeon]